MEEEIASPLTQSFVCDMHIQRSLALSSVLFEVPLENVRTRIIGGDSVFGCQNSQPSLERQHEEKTARTSQSWVHINGNREPTLCFHSCPRSPCKVPGPTVQYMFAK